MAVTAPPGRESVIHRPLPRPARPVPLVAPLLVAALALVGVVAVSLHASGIGGAVAAAALLVVPGVALVGACRIPDRVVRRALVVPVALAVDTVVAIAMTASPLWFPSGAAVAVLVVAGSFPLVRGVRSARAAASARTAARNGSTATAGRVPVVSPALGLRRRAVLAEVAAAAAVIALWVVVAGRTLAAAASGSPSAFLLPSAVTAALDRVGGVDGTLDALNRWPGAVATAAFLGGAAGATTSPALLSVVPAVLVLVDAALVLGLARTFGARGPVAWIGAVVLVATSAVAPAAGLPQSLGITLLLAVVLVAVRGLRAAGLRGARPHRAAAAATVMVLEVALAGTDPLTAIAAAVTIGPFLLSGSLRPRWLVVPLALVPVVALLPDVSRTAGRIALRIGLGPETDPFIAGGTGSGTSSGPLSTGLLGAAVVLAVTLLLGALTAVAVVRLLARGNRTGAALVAWLAVAPVLTALMFGADTVTSPRALGFTLPFLAVGVALAFRPRHRRPFVPRTVRRGVPAAVRTGLGLVLVAVAVVAIGTAIGSEPVPVARPAELSAARWLDGRFHVGDTLVTTDPMPVLVGADYGRYLQRSGSVVELTDSAPTPAALYRSIAAHAGKGSTWIVFRAGRETTLERSIASVSAERYHRDGVHVYELIYRGA